MKDEIIKLLDKGVCITNDKERDAILRICEKEGIKWAYNDKPVTQHIPNRGYPYLITYATCLDNKGEKRLIDWFFDTSVHVSFEYFLARYNELNHKNLKRASLVKEKIKNLKAGVLITNDRERDEFLNICQDAGLTWPGEESATNYKPEDSYPYIISCESELWGVTARSDDVLRYCSPDDFDEDFVPPAIISFDEFKTRLSNHQYEITISCYDGKTTTARMMIDGKEVKQAEARKLATDKFNWGIGARTAFGRLWGKEPKITVFNIGDKVKVREGFFNIDKYFWGRTGVVKKFYPNGECIGVELDGPDFNGHNLNHAITSNRGWWFNKCCLEKIK